MITLELHADTSYFVMNNKVCIAMYDTRDKKIVFMRGTHLDIVAAIVEAITNHSHRG